MAFDHETSVEDQSRYITNVEDERRLFCTLTRAKKFLYCSFAPGEGRNHQNPSQFLGEINLLSQVCQEEPYREWTNLCRRSQGEVPTVRLSFSEWKYFSQCPYMFAPLPLRIQRTAG